MAGAVAPQGDLGEGHRRKARGPENEGPLENRGHKFVTLNSIVIFDGVGVGLGIPEPDYATASPPWLPAVVTERVWIASNME